MRLDNEFCVRILALAELLDQELTTARLVALASAAGAAICLMGEQAASGNGHANRAMHKGLNFNTTFGNGCDLVQRALAGKDNTACALFNKKARSNGVGTGHLRGDMKGDSETLTHSNGGPVCDDGSINQGLGKA